MRFFIHVAFFRETLLLDLCWLIHSFSQLLGDPKDSHKMETTERSKNTVIEKKKGTRTRQKKSTGSNNPRTHELATKTKSDPKKTNQEKQPHKVVQFSALEPPSSMKLVA